MGGFTAKDLHLAILRKITGACMNLSRRPEIGAVPDPRSASN